MSLIYTLVYLNQGFLPWQRSEFDEDFDKKKFSLERKKEFAKLSRRRQKIKIEEETNEYILRVK